jgi:hypothetical protein
MSSVAYMALPPCFHNEPNSFVVNVAHETGIAGIENAGGVSAASSSPGLLRAQVIFLATGS